MNSVVHDVKMHKNQSSSRVPLEEDEAEVFVADVDDADVVVAVVEDGLEVVIDDPAIRRIWDFDSELAKLVQIKVKAL